MSCGFRERYDSSSRYARILLTASVGKPPSVRHAHSFSDAQYVVERPEGDWILAVANRAVLRQSDIARSACRASLSATFITADNPAGVAVGRYRNAVAQRALYSTIRQLQRCGLIRAVFPCRSVDPAGVWPDEHGVLAIGMSLGKGCSIARKYGQAALLHVDAGGWVRLIWINRSRT